MPSYSFHQLMEYFPSETDTISPSDKLHVQEANLPSTGNGCQAIQLNIQHYKVDMGVQTLFSCGKFEKISFPVLADKQ